MLVPVVTTSKVSPDNKPVVMLTLPPVICVSSRSETVTVESTVSAVLFSVKVAAANAGEITGTSLTGVIVIVPVRVEVSATVVESLSFTFAPSLKVTVKTRLGSVVFTVGSSLV